MQMLTIRELSQASGWPEGRIRKLIKSHRIDHVPVDGLTLCPANAIDEFLKNNLVKACPANPKAHDSANDLTGSSGSSATSIQQPDASVINQLALRIAERRK